MIPTTCPATPDWAVYLTFLPGPDRKRSGKVYQYRIGYRNPELAAPGCVMTWSVEGGRQPYQVALERTAGGSLAWHCTCADAVYRGELVEGHVCKHVRGLTKSLPPWPTTRAEPARRSA